MNDRLTRLATVLLSVAAGLMLGEARPAQADCLEVTAAVTYEDRPDWYPLGGPRHCVLPTPWPHTLHVHRDVEQDYAFVPDCLPDRVFVEAWVPLP